MKRTALGIAEIVGPTYDNTRTTTQGRMYQGTFGGKKFLSVPKNAWIDTVLDTGLAASVAKHLSPNNHLFVMTAEAGGFAPILLYNFNKDTGAKSYVGRINVALPDTAATTHTYRFVTGVQDSGATGWKIFIGTAGSVGLNSGLFQVHKVDLADFTLGGTNIPFATGNDQKAVYFRQDPSALGAAHSVNQTIIGQLLDQATTKIGYYAGSAASPKLLLWDYSVAPTWSSDAVTGTEATNTINHAGHVYNNGDPLVFTSLTGGAGLVAGTVYFVVGAVAGVSYQLSATSGGAAINFTTDITAAQIGRAFGTTGSGHSASTGIISPTPFGGTIINNSMKVVTPGHGPFSGVKSVFLATTTNFYLFNFSDITNGATSLPSVGSVNAQGDVDDLALTTTFATWSEKIDSIILLTNTSKFFLKKFVTSDIFARFGDLGIRYLETLNPEFVEFGMAAITSLDVDEGWIGIVGSTVGQRGVILYDVSSDFQFDQSYWVSKVFTLNETTIKELSALIEMRGANDLAVQYRTSVFGVITGGWVNTMLNKIIDLGIGTQVQLKGGFNTLSALTNAPYLYDLVAGTLANDEISDQWAFDDEQSQSITPAYSAFRLLRAYDGGVKALEFKALDDAGATLATARTDTDFAQFDKSSNTGTSWSAMTGANDYANTPLTTEIRFKWASPPGVKARVFVREVT